VPHMHPSILPWAYRNVQPIQDVADDAVDPLDAGGSEGFLQI